MLKVEGWPNACTALYTAAVWSLASPVLGVLSLSAVGSSVAGSNIMGEWYSIARSILYILLYAL